MKSLSLLTLNVRLRSHWARRRSLILGSGLLVLAALLLLQLSGRYGAGARAAFALIMVTTTADNTTADGFCSLREAILSANGSPANGDCTTGTTGPDVINFALGAGTPTINVTGSALPTITETLTIDGATGGATRVELNGAGAGASANGLFINNTDNCAIKSLVINRFNGTPGVNPASGNGIRIVDSDNTVVENCYIGTNSTGNSALANGSNGIFGFATNDSDIKNNLLSGNGQDGVYFHQDGAGCQRNNIRGNKIGTDLTGTAAIPNADTGIQQQSCTHSTIGGTTAADRNLLSGNTGNGMAISSFHQVLGNYVGVDVTGTVALGNSGYGIVAGNNCTIGGTSAGARNIVAASGADGIAFLSLGTGASSQVLGNYIGTDVTGTVDLGNNRYGVYIRESGGIVVGGTTSAERNIISGNTTVGVFLHAAADCQVLGNYIGPNVNGTAAFSSMYGIQVDSGAGNHLISGNVISGHSDYGVSLAHQSNNRLFGNIIGASPTLTAMPNGIGVTTGGATGQINQIGGTGTSEGNIIAFNNEDGVQVSFGTNHKISGNSIYSNGDLGIDLNRDGVTANDAGDGDSGTNNLQNFPVITQVTTNGIVGTLNSEANKMYTIQFFHNPACDTLGNGEGKTYIDQITVTTDGSGNALINYVGAFPSGGVVTATATENSSGNTSEFSSCQTVVDCPPTITVSPATLPNGFTGTAYNQTITASPAGNYNYTLTGGNLPDGLQLVQVNASTGAVTGTPTVPGMYTFTITATTNGVCTGSQTYTVYINCPGATITVTTTLDGVTPDDKCSLREAIMAANGVTTVNGCSPGVSGLDTIYFAIGSGTPFIPVLTTPLPTITSPVVIDGSQCQSTRVELSGALAGANANGLHITAGGSTVRAMVINRFSAHGIHLENNGTNKVENCLIGTDAGGTLDRGNGVDGIQILNSPNNRIGGTAAGQRNIISGNDQIGVEVLDPGASGNIIRGNFIGTDITGSQALSNVRDGVLINNASNNTVGGQATGAGNLISANGIPTGTKGAGVAIANPNAGANQVVRNLIGTTLSGGPLGNYDGVRILQGTKVNFISENTIANSERHGIWVGDAGTEINSILSNSIYSNGLLGIDLGGDGVTPNDALDADTGPNIRQNYPVLDQVLPTAITFTLDSEPATKYHVQFFSNTACDSSGYGEGRTLIGGITTSFTNVNGHLTATFTPTPALASGTVVTATATKINSSGGFQDTSEFSACKVACADITFTPQTLPNGFTGTAYNETITANPSGNYTYSLTGGVLPVGLNFGSNGALTGTPTTPGSYTFTVTATTPEGCTGSQTYTIFINCPGATITVTTAADEDGTNPGGCSLREAIQAANLDSPVGGCPAGVAGLDTIYFYIGTGTPTINILGSQLPTIMQPVIIDGSQCQSTRVELNGAGAGSNARGFLITAGGSTIRSMVINRFTESAISIATGGGNVIENCYLGTNSTGTAALANGRDGVRIASSANNRIGSLNSTVRNLISGNNEYGILISFAGSTGNQVLGNYIGLHVNGTQAIGNGLGGVRINDAQNNLIGGTSGGSRNYISGNVLDGVFLLGPNATGNVVQNNFIGITGIGAAPLGNGRDGVQIDGARDNLIGGASTIAGNNIANNAGAGVLVTDSAGAGTGNSILTNSIYDNQGLGIDLAPGVETNTGVTANDSGDGDNGPNELQNFPIVTLATHALVTGTLNSKANTTYRIQAFVSGCDPSGHGEGLVYLGHSDITTDASGDAGFSIVPITGAFTVGTAATATATEFVSGVLRSTSEFSACQTVTCPVVTITPATLLEGTESLAYSQQLTQTGLPTTPAPVWSISAGGLPTGLSIDPATGLISGTTFIIGNHTFTVRVQDANGCFGERQYTLKINPFCVLPVFNPDVLPNGRVGQVFSQQISITKVPEPQTFSLSSGIFPPGITLSPAGLLSGTPTQNGIFNFAIKVAYGTSCEAIKGYTLQVEFCQPITVNPVSIANGFVGTVYNQNFMASGGTGPYSFTRVNGTLPTGLSLATSGALTGTPTTVGTFTFEVRATDANGCFGERGYTVIIGGSGLQFYPLPASRRALETRPGLEGDVTPGVPILANTTLTLVMRTGCPACIPANATAVTGNITVVPQYSAGGYLTLFPSNAAQPIVANSNFKPNEVTNNVFTVGLGPADVAFKIFASATTDVIVDVTGYFAPPSPTGLYFHPLNEPVRLVETRTLPGLTGCIKPGAPFPAGATLVQGRSPVAAPCNVIPDTAQVLVGNATTIFPSAGGFLTIYSSDAIRPLAANSNFAGGDVINGPFAVKLGADGRFNVFTPAATELVIDILGYYSADAVDANGAGLLFTILPKPIRELETRPDFPGFALMGCFRPNAPIQGGAGGIRTQQIWGTCDGINIPIVARAMMGNVTVVNPAPNPIASGFLTHYPGNVVTPPTVATSNYPIPVIFGYNRFFVVGLSPTDGTFKMFTSTTTDVILDVSGYFAP